MNEPSSPALAELVGIDPVIAPSAISGWHKDRATLMGYKREARAALATLVQTPRYAADGTKFIIVCRARSGSTLLCKLLNGSPDIHCELEVLHHAVLGPRRFINALARRRQAPVYGCKILSYQMVLVQHLRQPEAFLNRLAEDGFVFVHLERGLLDQALSISVASQTGLYHRPQDDTRPDAPRTVRLDPDAFVKRLRWNEGLSRFERRLMADLPHHHVDYGRDLATPDAQQTLIDRLCLAFGARPYPVSAPLRRVLNGGFEAVVENASEIRHAVERAGLGVLFEAA